MKTIRKESKKKTEKEVWLIFEDQLSQVPSHCQFFLLTEKKRVSFLKSKLEKITTSDLLQTICIASSKKIALNDSLRCSEKTAEEILILSAGKPLHTFTTASSARVDWLEQFADQTGQEIFLHSEDQNVTELQDFLVSLREKYCKWLEHTHHNLNKKNRFFIDEFGDLVANIELKETSQFMIEDHSFSLQFAIEPIQELEALTDSLEVEHSPIVLLLRQSLRILDRFKGKAQFNSFSLPLKSPQHLSSKALRSSSSASLETPIAVSRADWLGSYFWDCLSKY